MVQTQGEGEYDRTIADGLLPAGTNVNHELVRDGWCWWYRKYAPAREYGAGRARERSTSGKEGIVGISAASAAVEVAETEQMRLCRQSVHSRKRHDDAFHVMG